MLPGTSSTYTGNVPSNPAFERFPHGSNRPAPTARSGLAELSGDSGASRCLRGADRDDARTVGLGDADVRAIDDATVAADGGAPPTTLLSASSVTVSSVPETVAAKVAV